MGNSPKDAKVNNGVSTSPIQSNSSPPQSDLPSFKQDETGKIEPMNEPESLAPPRRSDAPLGSLGNTGNTSDYFSVSHAGYHHSSEANPFEVSFLTGGQTPANGTGDQTPGGTKLPPVAALTSPAPILGPGQSSNYWGSLRSGPLSPAMLSGPQKDDYFSDGHHLRGGFPTPNESGLRTGLTPGGGGTMFPEPSPSTQALFGSLTSGIATPTTVEFQRTALNAAARSRGLQGLQNVAPQITSQPQDINTIDMRSASGPQFDGNDANDAANGLFLLAQSQPGVRNNPQQVNHYTTAQPMAVHAHPLPTTAMGGISHESSPTMANRNHGSISTASGRDGSVNSEDNDQQSRPNTRGKGKRTAAQMSQPNGRKTNGAHSKGPASKKAKNNAGHSVVMEPEPPSDDEQDNLKEEEYNANGKKMTEDEKRKNFLERNRVAALKCRQRKKQWLANLQQKVELFSNENDALTHTNGILREELVNLKTLLLAHKDCSVTIQQAQQGVGQQILSMEGYNQHMNHNPYAMSGVNGQGVMNGSVVHGLSEQRRFS